LQKALRGSTPPEPVTIAPKVAGQPPRKAEFEAHKADPAKFSQYSQKLHDQYVKAREENRPHFIIGGKEIYFPWAPVTLLRPTAKMTPYQAQFQVPRTFNKLDFRDYLWHVYGLRALNITTQIKWSEWTRQRMSRFRTTQVKKMIIDMEEPFVWPQEDRDALESHRLSSTIAFQKYESEMSEKQGSDLKKPAKAFDGIMGPYPEPAASFVPRKTEKQLKNTRTQAEVQQKRRSDMDLVKQYLKL